MSKARRSTDKPRQLTTEEVRERLLRHLWSLVDYWETLPDPCCCNGESVTRARISGFMHSALAALDGCSMELPAFQIKCIPHPDDKEYLRDGGENWFPPEDEAEDIGPLHEFIFRYDPTRSGNDPLK